MSDWLHNLPVVWMALMVFGFTYLVAAAIYAIVTVLTVAERALRAMSPIDRSMMMVEIGSSTGNAARPKPPPTAPDPAANALCSRPSSKKWPATRLKWPR
jgi:hypothetical protein